MVAYEHKISNSNKNTVSQRMKMTRVLQVMENLEKSWNFCFFPKAWKSHGKS